MPSLSRTVRCADRSILALLSAYQDYLVTFKLMKSQAVQRARPFSANIWDIGQKRVNCALNDGTVLLKRLEWRALSSYTQISRINRPDNQSDSNIYLRSFDNYYQNWLIFSRWFFFMSPRTDIYTPTKDIYAGFYSETSWGLSKLHLNKYYTSGWLCDGL